MTRTRILKIALQRYTHLSNICSKKTKKLLTSQSHKGRICFQYSNRGYGKPRKLQIYFTVSGFVLLYYYVPALSSIFIRVKQKRAIKPYIRMFIRRATSYVLYIHVFIPGPFSGASCIIYYSKHAFQPFLFRACYNLEFIPFLDGTGIKREMTLDTVHLGNEIFFFYLRPTETRETLGPALYFFCRHAIILPLFSAKKLAYPCRFLLPQINYCVSRVNEKSSCSP